MHPPNQSRMPGRGPNSPQARLPPSPLGPCDARLGKLLLWHPGVLAGGRHPTPRLMIGRAAIRLAGWLGFGVTLRWEGGERASCLCDHPSVQRGRPGDDQLSTSTYSTVLVGTYRKVRLYSTTRCSPDSPFSRRSICQDRTQLLSCSFSHRSDIVSCPSAFGALSFPSCPQTHMAANTTSPTPTTRPER